MNSLDLTLIATIISGTLFPAYALLTGKKTIRILEKDPEKLVWVYQTTSGILIAMCTIVLVSMRLELVPLQVIGLQFITNPIWVVSLIIASAISLWLTKNLKIPNSKIESIGNDLAGVQHILPKNTTQYHWAITTSFVAGVCEEIIFRGFLFWQLSQWMHFALAVLIVNLVFGAAHAATKLNNSIKAFGLGLLFSIMYLITDSLWLAILTHIIIDLYAASVSFKFAQAAAQQ